VLKGIKPLKFDWDEGNKNKNWFKHKVLWKECEQIFFNEPLKTFIDVKYSKKENRFVGLGTADRGRMLFVIFTIRKNKVRIISARDMSRRERKKYEKK